MNQLWPPAIILCLSIKCAAAQTAQTGTTDKHTGKNQLIISKCECLQLVQKCQTHYRTTWRREVGVRGGGNDQLKDMLSIAFIFFNHYELFL